MAWANLTSANQFVSFTDAQDSPFTKHYGFSNSNQFMTVADAIYYLDIVHSNLDGLDQGRWIWKGLLSSATVYQSAYYYESATRNNCGVESNPTTVTLIASTGQFTSTVSQVDANNQAINWVQANKQAYANSYAQCVLRATAWRGITPYCEQSSGMYYSTEIKGYAYKAGCGTGYKGTLVEYIIPYGQYRSITSQDAADNQAIQDFNNNVQQYANANGTCILSNAISIGNNYGGGIVAYICKPGDYGYDVNNLHGLIVSPYDQYSGNGVVNWNNGSSVNTNTHTTPNNDYGYGLICTNQIIAAQGNTGTYAAKLCRDLGIGGFSNWFLPTKAEINLVWANVPNALTPNVRYASSNEWDADYGQMWAQATGDVQYQQSTWYSLWVKLNVFRDAPLIKVNKDNPHTYIRACRYF